MPSLTIVVNCALGADPTTVISPYIQAAQHATRVVDKEVSTMAARVDAAVKKEVAAVKAAEDEKLAIRSANARVHKQAVAAHHARIAAIVKAAEDKKVADAKAADGRIVANRAEMERRIDFVIRKEVAAEKAANDQKTADAKKAAKDRVAARRKEAAEKHQLDQDFARMDREVASERRARNADNRRKEAHETRKDEQAALASRRAFEDADRAHDRSIGEKAAAAKRTSAERRRFAGRAVSNVANAGAMVGRMAWRGISAASRGMGMELDLTDAMKRSMELENSAVALSNQGYMPGQEGAAGMRQDPRSLEYEARKVANMAAYDPNDVMAGLGKFVGKTGDLEMGRRIMADMAKLSKATNAEFHDMVDAAADVSNELGTMEGKETVIRDIMRGVAAQGKLGAVEIKDLAKQMAKVAAAAGQFAGDRAQNILTLGAFAQAARGTGGAASATQAATSTMAFTAQFFKPARIAGMKGMGVNPHDAFGNIRSPEKVLLEVLQKSHGDERKWTAAFGDQQAKRIVRPWAQTYKDAYQHATGTEEQRTAVASAAYEKMLSRLRDETMKEIEINESFARAMATGTSQAQLFNNQLEAVGKEMREALITPMETLKPHLIGVAKTFVDIVGWGTKFLGIADPDAGKKRTFESGEAVLTQGDDFTSILRADATKYAGTPHYDPATQSFVTGEWNPAHVSGAEAKLEEMKRALAAARFKLGRDQARAPHQFTDENGVPLKRLVLDPRTGKPVAKPTAAQLSGAPILFEGYESYQDKQLAQDIDREKRSVDAQAKGVMDLEYQLGWLKDLRIGNSLSVTIAKDETKTGGEKAPPGTPPLLPLDGGQSKLEADPH